MDDTEAFEDEPSAKPTNFVPSSAIPPPSVSARRPPSILAPLRNPQGVRYDDDMAVNPKAKPPRAPRTKKPKADSAATGTESTEQGNGAEPKPRARKSPSKKAVVEQGEEKEGEKTQEPPKKRSRKAKSPSGQVGDDGEAAQTEGGTAKKRKSPSTMSKKEGESPFDETTSPTKQKRKKSQGATEEPEAFLKLDCMEIPHGADKEGKRFARYISKLPSILGRGGGPTSDPAFIGLTDSNTIGREHARLSFNHDTGNFELQLIGKNGALVNGQKFDGVEGLEPPTTIPLRPKDAVKLGDVGFYLCMPETDKPKKSYADLSVEALEAQKVHGRLNMSSREIALYIVEKYPFYNLQFGCVEKLSSLTKAIQGAISKSDKIVSDSKGVRGRVFYKLGDRQPKPQKSVTENEGKTTQLSQPNPSGESGSSQ